MILKKLPLREYKTVVAYAYISSAKLEIYWSKLISLKALVNSYQNYWLEFQNTYFGRPDNNQKVSHYCHKGLISIEVPHCIIYLFICLILCYRFIHIFCDSITWIIRIFGIRRRKYTTFLLILFTDFQWWLPHN